jgi:dihydrofolate reductase
MGTIVMSENVSLDGVVEDPAGVEGFRRGGWFFETDRGEDGERYTLDKTLGAEALLLGRRSYEFFAATWPSRGGALADKLNGVPKYVVSSTLEAPGWSNSTVLRGDAVDEASTLKRRLDGEIVVLGSAKLARTLLEHDLVDELRLMVYPVVLGAGARLFGETSDRKPMRLLDARTVGDGITVLTYAPVRGAERTSDGASLDEKRAAALRQAGIHASAERNAPVRAGRPTG